MALSLMLPVATKISGGVHRAGSHVPNVYVALPAPGDRRPGAPGEDSAETILGEATILVTSSFYPDSPLEQARFDCDFAFAEPRTLTGAPLVAMVDQHEARSCSVEGMAISSGIGPGCWVAGPVRRRAAAPANSAAAFERTYLRRRLRDETDAALRAESVIATSLHAQMATHYARRLIAVEPRAGRHASARP